MIIGKVNNAYIRITRKDEIFAINWLGDREQNRKRKRRRRIKGYKMRERNKEIPNNSRIEKRKSFLTIKRF